MLVDGSDPQIKQEILQLIVQYLYDEGYAASVTTVQDEANVRRLEAQRLRPAIRRLRRAVLDGDWPEVEKQCGRAISGEKEQKTFLYSAYRLQYLELLDGGEHHKVRRGGEACKNGIPAAQPATQTGYRRSTALRHVDDWSVHNGVGADGFVCVVCVLPMCS